MAATSADDAARQERREKKKALRKALAEAEAAESIDDAKAKRKRKRSNLPDEGEELEVDITAPEPLSKREQRLAKKGKFDPKTKSTAPPKSASPQQSESGDEEEDGKEDGDAAAAPKKHKKEKKEKSEHGIWIGNLPWTATRETLREFLVKHAGIADSQITRVNMPAPDKAAVAKMAIKPHNKGFAYVDFDSAPALEAVIGVSETLMSGRRVLIKNANSYEGRPKQEAGSGEGGEAKGPGMSKTQAVQAGGGKEPSKRIFVGNLTFDVTREDLVQHYSKCGEVADVFLATFQDSGKCKGYGWVTFETIDAAAAAVAGYVRVPVGGDDDDDSDEEMEDADVAEEGDEKATEKKAKKPKKMRKWFVNRLGGRDLRVEFAEDKQTRYKKRYGKEGKQGDGEEANERRPPRREPKKVDARNIKPGAALANAPRASGAIVEGQGTKITFD